MDFENNSKEYYRHCLEKARQAFAAKQREAACRWYTAADLYRRPDANLQDLADFLVVATEYRPDLARLLARIILQRKEKLPASHLQDLFCCALFIPDPDLEKQTVKRVLSEPLTPHICMRIADMYFDYASSRREQAKAVLWVNRAAMSDPLDFNDWAAKTHALHILVEDDAHEAELVLTCAQKALALAGEAATIDPCALDDLLESFDHLEDGPLLAKALYEQIMLNENLPLPEKHRIWQEQKELLQDLDF